MNSTFLSSHVRQYFLECFLLVHQSLGRSSKLPILHLRFFTLFLSCLKSLRGYILLIDFTFLYRIDLAWNCLLCSFYPGFFNCICLGFFFCDMPLFGSSPYQRVRVYFIQNQKLQGNKKAFTFHFSKGNSKFYTYSKFSLC